MSQVPLGRHAAKRPPLWLPYPGEGFFPTVTVEVPEIFPPGRPSLPCRSLGLYMLCFKEDILVHWGLWTATSGNKKKLPVFVGAMP